MNRTVLIVLSGFLGSGKTTLMLTAAEHLRNWGYSVACITNDQGEQLIDSKMVLKKELPLEQIQGGCFCCRFDELAASIGRIVTGHRPDVIIAEAVGSCTDLIATVVKPLEKLYEKQLDIRPLTVVVDPVRLAESLSELSTLTPEITYLFKKQLEEAQCIVLNKTDMLTDARAEWLENQLRRTYAGEVVSVSTLHDEGIAEWLIGMLDSNKPPLPVLDIDYDIYAEGEAQLGWFNGSFLIKGRVANAAALCTFFMDRITKRLQTEKAEAAHLKLWAEDGEQAIKMSSVGSAQVISMDLSPSAEWTTEQLTVWINARVHMAHDRLEAALTSVSKEIEEHYRVRVDIDRLACFAPGRPQPKYRMA